MPVPNAVKKLLDKAKINYDVSETPTDALFGRTVFDRHLRKVGAAKSIILQDGQGKLQALIPADCLLDLQSLNQHLSRNLEAAAPEVMEKFYQTNHVQSVPALPSIAKMDTVADSRLLNKESIHIDCGDIDALIQLDKAAFKQLMNGGEVLDFCIPLSDLEAKTGTGSDTEQITAAVSNFTSLRIKQRLEETLELPPLPETAQRIIKLRVDPTADVSDLAAIVETDPSLAAQVVSWAASPYYSAPGKIKSVHDAIVRVLGFDMVLNLSLGLALGKTLNMPKNGPRSVAPYWQQAVYAAASMEALVTAIPREHRPSFGLSYLSGLLNNFGYLILAEIFPPHFATISRYIEANPHVNSDLIEKHLLGITREQIASWLMTAWNLPDEVCMALRHQQSESYQGEHSTYANLTYTALQLLREHGIGSGPKEPVTPIMYEHLHLEVSRANEAINTVLESSEELQSIAKVLEGG